MKKSRSSKRQDKRRVTADLIRNSSDFAASRQSMPDTLVQTLFDAVDHRMKCRFGIIKLSAYDLDESYPVSGRGIEWEQSVTLLTYAALRCQDGIVSSLLRAGADPTAGIDISETRRCAIKDAISSLPHPYAAWIVRTVAELREQGAKLGGGRRCDDCGLSKAVRPLLWPRCSHVTCEFCFWQTAGSFSQVHMRSQ